MKDRIKWKKLGLFLDINYLGISWIKSHAMTPTPLILKDSIRLFFSSRNIKGESQIAFVDLDRNDPSKIISVSQKPLFSVGPIGTFDDSGTICTSIIRNKDNIYLYYTVYSLSYKVPDKNSIGMAISVDNGNTFERFSNAPILDRSRYDPYLVISPFVLHNEGLWHMWYASGTKWLKINDKYESQYLIKYAHSDNGINWKTNNKLCINPLNQDEANARPSVILDGNKLRMWFTYRGVKDFRNGINSYRIGYAESNLDKPSDWLRMDNKSILECSNNDYDSLMQTYPSIIKIKNNLYMFYNGNSFGKDGICLATSIIN